MLCYFLRPPSLDLRLLSTRHVLLLKVGATAVLRVGRNADVLDSDGLSSSAGDLDINRLGAKAALLLEEVVVLADGLLPGLSAVDTDFEALDRLVGVDDLHGEPPLRGAGLVVELDGGGDAAGDELVGGVDDAVGAAYGCESVGEEIEVAFVALGALIDDLCDVRK